MDVAASPSRSVVGRHDMTQSTHDSAGCLDSRSSTCMPSQRTAQATPGREDRGHCLLEEVSCGHSLTSVSGHGSKEASVVASTPTRSACGRGRGVRRPKRLLSRTEERRPRKRGVVTTGTGRLSGSRSPIPAHTPEPAAVAVTPGDADAGGDERLRENARLQQEMQTLRTQCLQQRKTIQTTTATLRQSRQAVARALVQLAQREDAEEHDRATTASLHLGQCRSAALPNLRHSYWEGGYEETELNLVKERIKEDRLAIERLRRQLAKQGRARATASSNGGSAAAEDAVGSGDDADDLSEAREICNHRWAFLGREESGVRDREQRLHVDRALHLKRLQRLEAAERSTFRDYPLLADRYQLLNMIGRGGFSEVYRAYDLEGNRHCAVKIHELGKDMSDQQRQSYIRRAMREYEIQKTLKHPRVVTLQDCFPISTKAFGTVLELCEGDTLDEYMKRHGPLTEKEARGIIIQVLSGLKYMNTKGQKIIHYDLKPGNLFFHTGEIKIADFGLSKVVHEGVGESIDLTSQGAGTYWYLPPECFAEACNTEPTKISNKVDVWSTGVIFFELLFHRRPFGHGQSQEALLRAAMAGQAFAVEVPALPKVSPEAKEFLKRLLTVRREDRPDVVQAYSDKYLRPRAKPSALDAGSQSQVKWEPAG